jgi:hypothetical protein
MLDPFGAVVRMLRADAAVLAIVGDPSRISGAQPTNPPCVQIIDNASTRRPFGPGSGRLGLQLWTGAARCYGNRDQSGTSVALARQLAGAASDALDHRGGVVGTTPVIRAFAPDIDGVAEDPDLRWPYYDVRLEIVAGTSPIE